MYEPLPAGFAWRPLEPAPLVPLHMFWKRASKAAARNFTGLALDVAQRAGWLAAPVAGAAAERTRSAAAPPGSHERDRPAPPAARALDLDREARDLEAAWARDAVEVDELLDLAVLLLEPGEVRLPQPGRVAGAPVVLGHVLEAAVEAVGVDADDADPLAGQPQRRGARHARLLEVGAVAEEAVAPGHEHHDVEGLERVRDRRQGGLEVGHLDAVARLLVAQVEHDAVGEEPL